MRILSLNYEFPPLGGGGGLVAKAVNELYVQKGFSVDLVTMHYGQLKIDETINGVRIFRVKSMRKDQLICKTPEMISFVISAIPFVLKLVKKNKYDIMHCHFAVPTGIIAYIVHKFKGLDYILTAHGSDIPGHNPDRFQFEHKFTRPLLRAVMRNAKSVVALSENLKSTIKRNVMSDIPITVIPNGIEVDMFSNSTQRNNWILMTGKFVPTKGFQYALAALKDTTLSGWEVHLIGEGPNRHELEALAKDIKVKVVFHGWLQRESTEFKNLIERSKIFIFPSEAENASLALLEAMNAGLAIITTRSTGCEETVGDCALLTNPRDVNGIKQAVVKLTQNENLISELGRKARQRTIDKFSWNKIIDEYLKITNKELTI